MPFVKGDPNAGRPKGSPNKETKQIREWIGTYLSGNIDEFQSRLENLSDKDYASNFLALMEYAVPKLQRTELVGDEQQGFKIIVETHKAGKKDS